MADNKIKYGLRNCYYSIVTEGVGGAETFGTPVALPGAVSMTLNAEGDEYKFFADDTIFFNAYANNGYSGELELALLPDSFRTDVLGEVADENGGLTEFADAKTAKIALLFEFQGDKKATRHILYKCGVSRPSEEANSKGEQIEASTTKLSFAAVPCSNGAIKHRASDTEYGTFYTAAPVLPVKPE